VRRLSEQFDATAYLQTAEQDIPLIAQIDPVKKVIISIRVEGTHIKGSIWKLTESALWRSNVKTSYVKKGCIFLS
jgi:hypothetical protein